jgi:nucleoside-diphosphate-sugar epimerase
MKKIFVTGHRGYIGVHLVDLLKAEGHLVTGCDLNLFEGCEWESFVKPDKELIQDIRSLTVKDLEGYDCIMHLAAISNDPMGDLDPSITYSINRDGTAALAEKAKKAGVPRFLFASSCSIYGQGNKLDVTENDPVAPLTAYAESKITAETHLSALANDHFSPVSLRNATAFGHSPMLRIDLVVNNLLACALSRGDIRVMSDGSPWRPLIHCRDIARAFVAFMHAPKNKVHNQVVNVGSNTENYMVRDVLNKVKELVPQANVVYTGEVGVDPRNYRVNFDHLSSLLPDFRLSYTLEKGMVELHQKYNKYGFKAADFDGDQFVRLRTLKKRLNKLTKS